LYDPIVFRHVPLLRHGSVKHSFTSTVENNLQWQNLITYTLIAYKNIEIYNDMHEELGISTKGFIPCSYFGIISIRGGEWSWVTKLLLVHGDVIS
jgi:hypothetical protein